MLNDKNIYTKLYEIEYIDFELAECGVKSNALPDAVIDIDLCSGLTSTAIWTGATVNETVLDYISLTGLDNFYVSDPNVYNSGDIDTGHTVTLSSAYTFTFHAVSGHNTTLTYGINQVTEDGICSQKLDGGFYQGFYKLYDYPIQLLPDRVAKGWSTNFTIKFPNEISSGVTANTLNDIYPDNSGFLFYIGTRAENKFRTLTSGETADISGLTPSYTDSLYNTIVDESNSQQIELYHHNPYYNTTQDESETSPTGETTNGPVLPSPLVTYGDEFITTGGTDYVGYYHVYDGIIYTGRSHQDDDIEKLILKYPDAEILDNSFGIRINSEGKIGYRLLKSTEYDYCLSGYTSGTTVSGGTAYILEEKYSDSKIWTANDDGWVDISVVFEREIELEGENLQSACSNFEKYRKGTLKIFVNGILVLKDDNFYELIPKALDTTKELQQGVPFNISFGGGTQGLYESVTFGGTDINDKGLLLEKYFAGTFGGNVKDFKFFIEPLDYPQIINNFNNKQATYSLDGNFGGRIVYKPQVT